LCRVSTTLANQMVVEPLLRDALEFAKQMELGRFASVAPLFIEQVPGKLKEQSGFAYIFQVHQGQVHGFADDARVLGNRRAYQVRREYQGGVVVEIGCELFLG